MASVTTRDYHGWQVVNLETPLLRVDVAPGKDGDLTRPRSCIEPQALSSCDRPVGG